MALSSKFVPLLAGFLDEAGGNRLDAVSYSVGDSVTLPTDSDGTIEVSKPDGTQIVLPADTRVFGGTDQPGLYRMQQENSVWQFAVNVDRRESQTATIDVEQLEQHGVSLGQQATASEQIEHQRHLRDVHVTTQHIMVGPGTLETVGRLLLGVDASTIML